ncbi:MAG: hypothetical protein V4484_11930 [Pseudomonadota bacterium]
MKTTDIKLQEQLLLARRVEGDRLMLADAILRAALDGSRTLTAGERAALEASPLTLRRFRALALERRRAEWGGSAGMLRAAASNGPLGALATDDGHWALHFLQQDGAWRVILALAPNAPFAARLVREQPMLRVVDGGGAIILQGSLDADGEYESAWPFDTAPSIHFHEFGARFAVEPVRAR